MEELDTGGPAEPGWTALSLDDASASHPCLPGGLRFLCTSCSDRDAWFVLCRPGTVAVNGVAVSLIIKVLADRDLISTAGEEFFFCTERPASVQTAPEASQPLSCPRCKEKIAAGTSAVRCSQCLVWYHQSDELPCWTYTKTCALCPQPTALDGSFRWTPKAVGA